MRKIKFRGMDLNGEWHYGLISVLTTNNIKGGTYISNSAGTLLAYKVRPETVGQFTGFLDKYGKEIYEGDLLANGVLPQEVKYKKDVQINYGHGDSTTSVYLGFQFSSWGNSEDTIKYQLYVVGNIHENKDLII